MFTASRCTRFGDSGWLQFSDCGSHEPLTKCNKVNKKVIILPMRCIHEFVRLVCYHFEIDANSRRTNIFAIK